jgi:amidase
MSPLGLSNDGLGSLRHPAQCRGVTALKPTLGRVRDATSAAGPEVGAIGAQLVTVGGPLARRVADLRAALEVIAGPTWRNPWSVPAPLRGPRLARPIRVAVVVDPAGQGTAAQVQEGVRRAARALEDAGTRSRRASRRLSSWWPGSRWPCSTPPMCGRCGGWRRR